MKQSPKRFPVNYIFIILTLIIVILWVSLLIYRKNLIAKNKSKDRSLKISSLEEITLGGVEQWILIRSENLSNPVLLFLHGGPGAPLFPYARDIGQNAGLEKLFTVVYWEQRGTGKSYDSDIPLETMTFEQLISDAESLIQILKYRFRVSKISIMCRSWGSLIGIYLGKNNHDHIERIISIGQMVAPLINDSLCYEYAMQLASLLKNEKALKSLEEIGPPPYDSDRLIRQRKWLTKLSDTYLTSNGLNRQSVWHMTLDRLLSTPEYSFFDILKMGMNPFFSIKNLWNNEFYAINVIRDIPKLEIPVLFIIGRKDFFTPGLLVQKYYEKLSTTNGKEIVWFEDSGHHPEYDQPEKFYQTVSDFLE